MRHLSHIPLATVIGILAAFAVLSLRIIIANFPGHGSILQPNGQLLGGDFITFYNAGLIAQSDLARLYDLRFQKEHFVHWLGSDSAHLRGELPFVYPPLIAAVFSLLALMSYKTAYCWWFMCGLSVALFTIFRLAREHYRFWPAAGITAFATLGYIPLVLNCLASGQLAWLGIAIFGWTYLLFLSNPFASGFLFSFSYYKPPLFVLALLVFLIRGGPKFRLGFMFGAVLLVTASLIYVGPNGLLSYIQVVSSYTYGSSLLENVRLPTDQGAGIYALIFSLTPSAYLSKVLLLGCLVCATLAALACKTDSAQSLGLFYCFVLVSSVAFSVQCIRYDLSILLVSFMIAMPLLLAKRTWLSLATLGCLGAFYLEWLFRKLSIGSHQLNLSSMLFMVVVPLLASCCLYKFRTCNEDRT